MHELTRRAKQFILPALFFLLSLTAVSQHSAIYHDPEAGYVMARELLDKGLYTAAQEEFGNVVQHRGNVKTLTRISASYYHAFCASRLEQKQAEHLLIKFVSSYPESIHADEARLELGLLYFRQKKFRPAIKTLELVDVYYLNPLQTEEYYYKLGYSYFSVNDQANATKAFFNVKDKQGPYAVHATYYYAHLAYQAKNYETALQSFLKLKDHPQYIVSVPYYVSQIYYLQEKYEQLITYATPLLEHSNPQNSLEISRMIGEAYFRQMKYAESVPFLKAFQDHSNKVTREDQYQLGYAYYRSDEYALAVPMLEKSLNIDDAMTQNAYYMLADCFLKLGKKQNARNAFRLASQLDYDKEIKENSLFDYARLSYELNMQSDAVGAFQNYRKQYPASYRVDIVNQHLADIFLTTRNYKDALTALESIQVRSESMKAAYQRTAYYRAVELFNDVKYREAANLFTRSLIYPVDGSMAALAHYWQGEAYYNMKSFSEAVKAYSEFLYSPRAASSSLFNTANYNIGYSYFRMEDYGSAGSWFRKYLKNEEAENEPLDPARWNDALLRIADCYFIQKEYNPAAEYYDRVMARSSPSSDYAYFQRAMIYGIQNKLKEKAKLLSELATKFPNSSYFDDALYESAHTAFILGDNEQALAQFKNVIDKYPKSSYVAKSLVGTGQIYFNQDNDEEALQVYRRVVSDFAGTQESRTALQGIKNIYVGQGNAAEYLKYAETVPFADNTRSTRDSVTYEAAEVVYMKGDCDKALRELSAYLDQYADGSFTMNATFYKAECQYRARQHDLALKGYEAIINAPKSTFTETSLLRAAGIYFQTGNYEKAFDSYAALESISELKPNLAEAHVGKMRSSYLLRRYDLSAESARKVDTLEKVTNELRSEAKLIEGKSLLMTSVPDTAGALKRLAEVAGESSERGAEAKYMIAMVQRGQAKIPESQKTIFDLVNQVPSYDDWIARGFILLADTYLDLGDSFQAKATLQSIISNYDGNDRSIIPDAVSKLNHILDEEKLKLENEMKEKLVSPPDTTTDAPSPEIEPEHE